MKTDWIKLLSTEELKELYFNTPRIKKQILSELKTRGVELNGEKFSYPLLRSQISIQFFLKNCGFNLFVSAGDGSEHLAQLKWRDKHELSFIEFIKQEPDTWIQLCGIELSPIESISDVCFLSWYSGKEPNAGDKILQSFEKPFRELLTEPVFSNELKNWRM